MGAIFNQRTFQDATGVSAELSAKWHEPITSAMRYATIHSAERVAMFLAQCGHESGGFKQTEESLNYTPEALLSTWPKRFTPEWANRYGRKPGQTADQMMIGVIAYGGRMGNDAAPSTDGYDYRGRGLIQITGKDNYRAFGAWCVNTLPMFDFMLDKPETVAEPTNAALSAAWYWQANKLNKWADARDLLTASRVINCGSATTKATPNGMEDRARRYKLAIAVMTGRK